MLENRLKIGVVGLGEVAQIIHLPILTQLSDRYEIVALCDISEQLLRTIGQRYSINNLYTDVHQMVAQKDIDVVFVLNSDVYHTESILAAIANSKHVFVEKPMCLTLREAKSIIEAREAAGVQVMVGYMRRYAPAFLEGVEEVKQLERINYVRVRDIIGPNAYFIDQTTKTLRFNDIPHAAQVETSERFQALMAEAVGDTQLYSVYSLLCGLSVHDLSAMREMLGFPRQVVSAVKGPGQFLTALFEFDGYHATFETGMDHQGRFDASLEVLGETKTVRVKYDTPYIRHLPTKLFVSESVGEMYSETEIRTTYKDPYTCELEALYDNIASGQQPKTTPEDFKKDLLLNQMILEEIKHTQKKAQTPIKGHPVLVERSVLKEAV